MEWWMAHRSPSDGPCNMVGVSRRRQTELGHSVSMARYDFVKSGGQVRPLNGTCPVRLALRPSGERLIPAASPHTP